MMKRSWAPALVALLLALPAFAQETPPSTGIQVGGVAKVLYSFAFVDDSTRYRGQEAFSLSLVDLRFNGELGEHIDWNMEVAASWYPDYGMGNLGAIANPNETGAAGIRQASIRFSGIIPYTTIEIGTFIPHLTNYMPRKVENLDLIQYPLMNNATFMDDGPIDSTIDMSPWQQTGFNAEIRLPYMIDIDFGVWNGMMPNFDTQPDTQPSKAASISLSYRPIEHLTLSMGHWGEDFQWDAPGSGLGHGRQQLNIFYFWGSYLTDTIEVTADFSQASIPSDDTEFRWEGAQATVGYWFRPNFEALFRYEYFDPNTLDTVKTPTSRYDRDFWYTLGINYRFNDNAELSVNYVIKQESGKMIERDNPQANPTRPTWDPEYNGQHNNLLLVQFQLWQ